MRICAKEICIFCRDFLSNMKIVENGGLISSKNRGGLSFPSIEFPKVVRLTNSVFEVILKKEPNPQKIKNLVEIVTKKVGKIICDEFPTLFVDLDVHVQSSILGSHRMKIIKKIAGCLISMRAKHICKLLKAVPENLGVHYSKLVLLQIM